MAVETLEKKVEEPLRYEHARYDTRRRILRFLIRTIGVPWLLKIDQATGIENVPANGPVIVMINHIAFIDPVLVLHLLPRNLVPMAKVEVFDYPVISILVRIWGVIPVRREEGDRRSVRMALDVLQAGEMILVAPEATRSPALQQGKEGIAYLASRSGAPVLPVAIDGTKGFPTYPFSARWRGQGARVQIGRPFRFHQELAHADRTQLRQMTDEAMYILSALLPQHRRGFYADLSQATQNTLVWV